MNPTQLRKLLADIRAMHEAGAAGSDREMIKEWADAYCFSREDVLDVLFMVLDDQVTMPFLVVNTRTEAVLSRHQTAEAAERAMLALDPKPHTHEGSVDLAVADDRTAWRRVCDGCGCVDLDLNQRPDIQRPTTASGGPFRDGYLCDACNAEHPEPT